MRGRNAVSRSLPTDPAMPLRTARPWWWRYGKVVIVLGLAALAGWAVSGKSDELSGASSYFTHMDWAWLAVAVVAELMSYVAFASMQRRLLGAGDVRLRITPITGVTLAGNAIQNSLPAGLLLASAFSFRQYRRFGADDVLSGWVVVAVTVLSLMSLSLLAAVGLAMAVSAGSALDLATVIMGLVALTLGLVALWARRRWLLSHAVRVIRLSKRLIHRPAGEPQEVIDEWRLRLAAISPSRHDWLIAGLMAAANWILDLLCLVTAFLAVNASVPWRGLLLAYTAAQLASNLPITPGGLGVVEGSLTIALVAFGGAEASTVAAVLVYRLFNFWMMLPVGWGAWGVLTMQTRRDRLRAAALMTAEVSAS